MLLFAGPRTRSSLSAASDPEFGPAKHMRLDARCSICTLQRCQCFAASEAQARTCIGSLAAQPKSRQHTYL
eukprot:1814318-Rhodomonas_salina.2